jgi:hypothetical protein
MLDLFGIMFSSIIMLLVILRAVQLDNSQPWFRPTTKGQNSSGLRLKPEHLADENPQGSRSLPLPGRSRGTSF